MSDSDSRPRHDDYLWFVDLSTRWMDNDLYGHVNNVVYYSYIDTVVNRYLIEHAKLDIHNAEAIGVTVESGCLYHAPVSYPDLLSGGLRVARVGRTSVVYEVGIFLRDEPRAVASGHFAHVFVERKSMRPVAIPPPIRSALEALVVTPPSPAP